MFSLSRVLLLCGLCERASCKTEGVEPLVPLLFSMIKNRYIVFAGGDFVPTGGWNDYHDKFDTLSKAIAFAKKISDVEWIQIVDLETFKIIEDQNLKH